ncbi:hypothetical protein BDV06DRAFT_226118 [Aspergillus oleicola]
MATPTTKATTYTDQKSWAFISPLMLLDENESYNRKLEPSADEEYLARCFEEKGHSDLAEIVRQGRVLHLFRFCNKYDLTTDFEGIKRLFYGLRKGERFWV